VGELVARHRVEQDVDLAFAGCAQGIVAAIENADFQRGAAGTDQLVQQFAAEAAKPVIFCAFERLMLRSDTHYQMRGHAACVGPGMNLRRGCQQGKQHEPRGQRPGQPWHQPVLLLLHGCCKAARQCSAALAKCRRLEQSGGSLASDFTLEGRN
jgi:hypothetical protein